MRYLKNFLQVALCAVILAPVALAQDGQLQVKAKPKKTGVFVDGKYVGTSGRHALPAGEHEVMLSEACSSEHTSKVRIESGKTAVLEHRMASLPLANPPFGTLSVAGGAEDSAVLVNGRYMGQAREFRGKKLQLNPGQFLVEIMARGGGVTHKEKISVTEKQVTTVQAR